MGFSCVTTVLCGAKDQDLTDLATVKDEMSLTSQNTSNDGWLRRAVRNVSGVIATYCQRTFMPELVEDSFDIQQDPYPYQTPGGFSMLQLSRWPIVELISVELVTSLGSRETLTEGEHFRLNRETGELQRLNRYTGVGGTWDAMPVIVRYVGGYGLTVDEAHTVPAVAPFTVTPDDTAFSSDISVSYADGSALIRVSSAPTEGQYTVSAGVYRFNAADAEQELAFHFASRDVPPDLTDITLRLITARFKAKDRDPMLVSQDTDGVGTQRWWVGGAPGQTGPFPPEIAGLLDQYNMPVVA